MKLLPCKILDFLWNFTPENEAYQSISAENDPWTIYAQNWSLYSNPVSNLDLATGGAT